MALSRGAAAVTRFTLVLLILTSITLLTLDFRGFGPIDSVRSAVLDGVRARSATSPATRFRPVGNVWNGAFDYDDLKRENEALRASCSTSSRARSPAATSPKQQLRSSCSTQLDMPFLGDLPTAKATVSCRAPSPTSTTPSRSTRASNDRHQGRTCRWSPGAAWSGIVVQVSRTGRRSSC